MSIHKTSDGACVPNIGPSGRRQRLIGGAVMLVIGLATAVLFVGRGASPTWLAALLIPFTAAALGYFQARERT